jgi:hypothetical protein
MNNGLAPWMVRDHVIEQHRMARRSDRTGLDSRSVAGVRRRLGLGLIQLGLHVMRPPRPPVLINSHHFGSRSV